MQTLGADCRRCYAYAGRRAIRRSSANPARLQAPGLPRGRLCPILAGFVRFRHVLAGRVQRGFLAMTRRDWSKGDTVLHSLRPEWGSGEVLAAESTVHEGRPCQKLTIRFSRAGTKTISTGFVELRHASDGPRLPEPAELLAPTPPPSGQPAQTLDPEPDPLVLRDQQRAVTDALTALPDPATDPFSSMRSRLAATLDLYRYTPTGASLLDWAAVQTGLRDPLSRFNRHELEQWFSKFQMERDGHLRKLLRDARRQEPAMVEELLSQASQSARAAARRADQYR